MHLLSDALQYVGCFISVVGSYLNAKGKKSGFLFWLVGNLLLLPFAFLNAHWGLVALQTVYICLNVVGIRSWKGDKDTGPALEPSPEQACHRRCSNGC